MPSGAHQHLAPPGRVPARVAAWRPAVPGIAEVFHAHFVDHAYPPHTHDAWTLLIVDDGAIQYDLDHDRHGAAGSTVTVLPPHVPHNGRAATAGGFRKRVVYLEPGVLGEDLIGRTAREPSLSDGQLRRQIHLLHEQLTRPGDGLAAECRLAFIRHRLRERLGRPDRTPPPRRADGVAADLRDLLDAHVTDGITLAAAADLLGVHPTHLVRAFGRRYGLPPHGYLTGRRIDLARRLLLAGQPPAVVAAAAGFSDQSHLTRHFVRYLGVPPARYARAARR